MDNLAEKNRQGGANSRATVGRENLIERQEVFRGEQMRIKQSTFYALRIIYRIHKEENEIVTSAEIAEKEEISQGVGLKILRKLAQAGIMQVHQGRGQICGGFSMIKTIDEITLSEVLGVMEGIDICTNLDKSTRNKEELLFRTCCQINGHLGEIFSRYTIRDLFESDEKVIF